MLSRFHACMTKKVANFEDIARGVIDETARIAAELITRLGSVLDPLADPSGVPAVNGVSIVMHNETRRFEFPREETASRDPTDERVAIAPRDIDAFARVTVFVPHDGK